MKSVEIIIDGVSHKAVTDWGGQRCSDICSLYDLCTYYKYRPGLCIITAHNYAVHFEKQENNHQTITNNG